MTARWTFADATESYTFEINPGPKTTVLDYVKTFAYAVAAGPAWPDVAGGGLVIKDEPAQVPKLSFGGTTLSQSEYVALKHWSRKTVPIIITDDFGRSITAYIVDFQPQRVRKAGAPWYHTFTARAVVLGLAGGTSGIPGGIVGGIETQTLYPVASLSAISRMGATSTEAVVVTGAVSAISAVAANAPIRPVTAAISASSAIAGTPDQEATALSAALSSSASVAALGPNRAQPISAALTASAAVAVA